MLVVKFSDGRVKGFGLVKSFDVQSDLEKLYIDGFDGYKAYQDDFDTSYFVDSESYNYDLKYVDSVIADGVTVWSRMTEEE